MSLIIGITTVLLTLLVFYLLGILDMYVRRNTLVPLFSPDGFMYIVYQGIKLFVYIIITLIAIFFIIAFLYLIGDLMLLKL